jgi:pimeloyl-ACP methyl ester carboxylesterase
MGKPRLLLVPEFTDLSWTIRPRLEEWAEVASYDPPGVGEEPLPKGASAVTPGLIAQLPELTVQRGLEELDRAGWERFFVVGDGFAVASAIRIAEERLDSIEGLALGHARLSNRRDGERAPISGAVWEGLTQLLRQDHEAFIRYGIAQATGGSLGAQLAEQMLGRFPKELIVPGWEAMTAEDDAFAERLGALSVPLLFAKHEGCLMCTDEGFEDAAAASPNARTVAVADAPTVSEDFAEAVREFCQDVQAGD